MSVPSRVLATYPLCAFLYSQSLRPFLSKGSYGYSARQQLKILLQKRSLAVVGSSDEVYLMDFRFAFLFLTQILTQIAENYRGAERSDLRVWGDFGPQKVWKVLRRSGRRNSPQLITRRSLVQVQPPQPQNRLISQEIRRFFFTFCLKKFSEKLCGFAKFAVDPNRDPYGSKNRHRGGVSASGSSCFWERFWGIYNAAVRTLSMALAASFWAAVVTWA